MPDPDYWGTRTDILVANDVIWRKRFNGECEFWLFPLHCEPQKKGFNADKDRWMDYYHSFRPSFSKPSAGLIALFCCEEQGIEEVSVIGYDWFFSEEVRSLGRDHKCWPHDVEAERKCMDGLNLKVINLA